MSSDLAMTVFLPSPLSAFSFCSAKAFLTTSYHISIKISGFHIKYKVTESSSSPSKRPISSSSSTFSSFFSATTSLGAAVVGYFFSYLPFAGSEAAPHVFLISSLNLYTSINQAKTLGLVSALGTVSLSLSYVSLSTAVGCYL